MTQKIIYILLAVTWCSTSFINAAIIPVNSANEINTSNPSPGDTLLMSKSANWADQDIIADFNGTENNPITLLAEGNGEVILSGGATLQIAGAYVTVSGLSFQQCASTEGGDLVKFRTSTSNVAQNCRLTNCYFSDNNPSDLDVGYKWVSLYGKENRVDHCWFELKKHRGTTLVVWLTEGEDPNFHRIDHNYFTRPELSTGNNEAETIRIGDSQRSLVNSNTIVEYNYFEECDGEIESISNKSCYNVYRYNTFFNNASILTLRHGHYCTVEGNYFLGNNVSGSGGVRIIGVGHKIINNYMQDLAGSGNLRAPIVLMGGVDGFDVNDATNRYVAAQENLVANNTIVNCNQNIYVGSDKSSSDETYNAPFDNHIYNNIIYNGEDPVVKYEYDEIESFEYLGNIFYNTTLNTSETGFTETNPQLTLGTNLSPAKINDNSPAINASVNGSLSYTLSEDFDGQARIGKYDVGCDEYSSSEVNRSPVQKNEVGPCWLNPDACSDDVIVDLPSYDCNGDEDGTASIDDCDVCSGGTTGITPNSNCEQDCNQEWNGTATIDQCDVCSGGSTGIETDACLQCDEVYTTSDDGNIGENVLDGDLNTRWSAEDSGEYIEFCLGNAILLDAVSIAYSKGNERTSSFHVEVSEDGSNWTRVIENQTSSGNTLELEAYSFPLQNVLKLRIIGLENSVNAWNSITEVAWNSVITSNSTSSTNSFTVYPNPTNSIVNIRSQTVLKTLEVSNTFGETTSITVGNNSYPLDLSSYKSGIYFLKVIDEAGEIQIHKVIKK